jgi:hypothetical protein
MKLWQIYLESTVSRNIQVVPYDDEGWDTDYDPYIVADQAEKIASESGIRIASNKNLSYVALDGDTAVGAVWSDRYHDDDQDADVYDFDMAIDNHYRNQVGTFLQLMDAALNDFREMKAENPRTFIRVWVVNPRLASVLEKRYDFEFESQHGDSSAHMVYYGE